MNSISMPENKKYKTEFWIVSTHIKIWFGFGVFCLMAYQLFLGYLMPKPFSLKNSSGTI